MTRSSCASRKCSGFTLVEVLVVTSVLSILLTAMCGIYFASITQWDRQQNQGNALNATTRACTRIGEYVALAANVQLVDRFGTGVYDGLLVCLPAYTYNGGYIWTNGKVPEPAAVSLTCGGYEPTWNNVDGRLRLRYAGANNQWICFYLSDSTGSPNSAGNILWAATVDKTSVPSLVSPDADWSRYNTRVGKVAPLTAIRFSVDDSMNPNQVTITAVSSYKNGMNTSQMTRSQTVCLRNAR